MRVVIQRVKEASVTIDHLVKSAIGPGLLILCSFEDADTQEDISWCVKKICQLRIFNDEEGVMNRSVMEVSGSLLVVSQFTLHALTKKGNRPSYVRAASGEVAIALYDFFCETLRSFSSLDVQTGTFGADMAVRLLNDGPVTIIMDTKNKE